MRALLAALLALASVPASAVTYTFTLSGADYNGSGTIEAVGPGTPNDYPCPTCVTGLGLTVTGITGTINGAAITGVAPLNSVAGNNNKIYGTAPYVDWGDLGIATADHLFNVFNGDFYHTPGTFIAVDNESSILLHPVSFTLAPVPEPGEWAMLGVGLAVAGGVARRRKAR